MANKKATKPIQFEQALKSLDDIVAKMETQELSLEEALAQFESGIALAKQCQETLQKAKLRVETLLAEDENIAADQINGDQS